MWLCCLPAIVRQEYVLAPKEQVDVHVRHAAVLRALPAYLHDDDSGFLKQWDVSQYIYFDQRVKFLCYSNPVNH